MGLSIEIEITQIENGYTVETDYGREIVYRKKYDAAVNQALAFLKEFKQEVE